MLACDPYNTKYLTDVEFEVRLDVYFTSFCTTVFKRRRSCDGLLEGRFRVITFIGDPTWSEIKTIVSQMRNRMCNIKAKIPTEFIISSFNNFFIPTGLEAVYGPLHHARDRLAGPGARRRARRLAAARPPPRQEACECET